MSEPGSGEGFSSSQQQSLKQLDTEMNAHLAQRHRRRGRIFTAGLATVGVLALGAGIAQVNPFDSGAGRNGVVTHSQSGESSPSASKTNPKKDTGNVVSGQEYGPQTEAAMGHVINPKAEQIAKTALGLASRYPTQVSSYSVDGGFEEISGNSENQANNIPGAGSIDVVVGLTDGKPDPTKVVYAEITSDAKNGSEETSWVISFSTPEGVKFAQQAGLLSAVQSGGNIEGYTAYASQVIANNGVENTDLSGINDTTDSRYFATDASGNPTGPLQTAMNVGDNVNNVLSTMSEAFEATP